MELKGRMFYDISKQLFFGYLEKYPAVCSQGKSHDEVVSNLKKYFKQYLSFMDERFEIKIGEEEYI